MKQPKIRKYATGKDVEDYADTLNFLKEYEGFRDTTYFDGNGIPTIGYGFTDSSLVKKGRISRNEADQRLLKEVQQRDVELRNIISNWDKLSNNSKTALRSYYYNYPKGFRSNTKFMQHWNNGNYIDAIGQVDAGMNDRKNPGLRTRRLAEQQLLLSDPYLNPRLPKLYPIKPVDLNDAFKSPEQLVDRFEMTPMIPYVGIDRNTRTVLNVPTLLDYIQTLY